MGDKIYVTIIPNTLAHDNGDGTYSPYVVLDAAVLASIKAALLPVYSLVTYAGGTKDTGDLEAGTATIVPTTRPAIGAAQYSSVQTLAVPSNQAILSFKRLMSRIAVTIGTMGTSTNLYLSVRVDVDDTAHEIFSESWTTNGAKVAAVDIHAGFKPIVFALLTDGLPHTFYFMFWAQTANQATVTLVDLWFGAGSVGITDTYAAPPNGIFRVTHTGGFLCTAYVTATGGGNASGGLRMSDNLALVILANSTPGVTSRPTGGAFFVINPSLIVFGTVATDTHIIEQVNLVVKVD